MKKMPKKLKNNSENKEDNKQRVINLKKKSTASINSTFAILKNHSVSYKKTQLLIRLIKRKSVQEAIFLLNNVKSKRSALSILKLLWSVVANWKINNNIQAIDLYELRFQIRCSPGKTMKRTRPAPQGRATVIRKRSCHIYLEVYSLDSNQNK